jgi:peptidyl-prolyl cis-trans isomerase D
MLQAIRSKAGSLIVKILFALLIISFGVWGIADVFRQRTAAETTVANVGGIKIQADELQVGVNRQIENLRRLYGSFTIEQAKQLGIVDGVLNNLIGSDLFMLEERRLQVMVDDQVVRDAIVANPNFHNSAGTFDPNLFKFVLSNNQLSEARYVSLVRQDTERAMLTSAVASGATAPRALIDPLFRRQDEKRIADTVLVPFDKMADIGEPSESDLQDVYDKHRASFRTPEYRGLTALVLRPDDLVGDIDVPEDKLRTEYDARLGKFQTPDRREIEQILVPDKAKAEDAMAQLATGKDFVEVAKNVADQDESAVKFGWIERKDMPPALGDVAFALAKDETSKPVEDGLGWHILRITGIDAGGTQSFDEVRNQLKTEVARDMAADELFKEHNDIEDALAGGATLDQIGEKFKMKLTKVEAIDPDGRMPNGERGPLTDGDILHAAFNTESGQTTRLTETKDNGYFLLRVDSVTPSAEKPLSEVKGQVKDIWLAEKRSAAAAAAAKDIAAAVAAGKSLVEIAGEKQLPVSTSPPVRRSAGGQATLLASLVARIFELKPGETGISEGPNGWYVAQLKSIEVPDPAAAKTAVDQLSDQLTQGIQSDLLAEFDKALRGRYRVEIRQDEIDRAF